MPTLKNIDETKYWPEWRFPGQAGWMRGKVGFWSIEGARADLKRWEGWSTGTRAESRVMIVRTVAAVTEEVAI